MRKRRILPPALQYPLHRPQYPRHCHRRRRRCQKLPLMGHPAHSLVLILAWLMLEAQQPQRRRRSTSKSKAMKPAAVRFAPRN